jgi:glutamyl-tRNA(Gln) amidotransferase subunit D
MAEAPSVGSRVKLRLETLSGDTVVEGVILPPAVEQHVTVKLSNGYNLSHPLNQTHVIESVAKEASTSSQSPQPAHNPNLPSVRIIHTGGTIASKVDYVTGAVTAQFEPSELVHHVPELQQIANIDAHKIGNMFSEDIRPIHWNQIIDATEKAFQQGCDGVVVTHGTDTLHISSSAVAFAWCGEGNKTPGRIAFVGSQRSSDRASSDAAQNLIAAVTWAAQGPTPNGNLSDCVVVAMHRTSDDGACSIHAATGVRKLHSSRRDAFRPVNTQPLATITIDESTIEIHLSEHYENNRTQHPERGITTTASRFDTDLSIRQFMSGPWLLSTEIDEAVESKADALVLHGTGLGHVPIENPNEDAPQNLELRSSLQKAIDNKIPILIVNQCIHGPVDMNVYSKGRIQQEMGILGHGITTSPEAAIVKLHYALSTNKDVDKILTSNLFGEEVNQIRD